MQLYHCHSYSKVQASLGCILSSDAHKPHLSISLAHIGLHADQQICSRGGFKNSLAAHLLLGRLPQSWCCNSEASQRTPR